MMNEIDWKGLLKEHKRIVILLVLCIGLGFLSFSVSPGNVKMDKKKEYVYAKETSRLDDNQTESNLPVINVKGKDAKELNAKLDELYHRENTVLTYGYQLYEKYLSVVYWIITLHEDSSPTFEMKTAVFYLPNKKLVSTEDLLKKYGITREEAFQKMDEKMQFYYHDIIEKGYIDRNECDYNAFLEDRQLSDDYTLQLFIDKDGVLKSYRAFNVYSFYDEHLYFTDESFQFELATDVTSQEKEK